MTNTGRDGDLKYILLFYSLINGGHAHAQLCNQRDVHSFERKLNAASAQTFSYHYKYIASTKKDAPLVIYIPGGPGGTSIGSVDPRVSAEYSLVLTDPRGSGCNDSAEIALADISSEAIADDLIQLIKHLKPTNYIVHGHSYGTVVATILSAKIAQENITQPQSIFLEGVFGRYWDQRKEEFGLTESWNKTFPQFSPQLQNELLKTEQNPYGLKVEQGLKAVYQFLYLGKSYFLNYSPDDLLKYFSLKQQGQSLPSDLKKLYGSINLGSLPSGEKTWAAIACNELFSVDEQALDYSYGKLNSRIVKLCKETRARHYDSADWQIAHPTVYFLGKNDSATPLWQGEYHYENQKKNLKTVFKVPGAGHRPLQLNLNDCIGEIFKAQFKGLSLKAAVKRCAAPVEIF